MRDAVPPERPGVSYTWLMDRSELARRLKAARALAGFTKPATLAAQPLMQENGIKASRIREMESVKGRVEVRPMELEVIARACGLPEEWFTAPFERLRTGRSLGERLDSLEGLVRALSPGDLDETLRRLAQLAREDADAARRREDEERRRR